MGRAKQAEQISELWGQRGVSERARAREGQVEWSFRNPQGDVQGAHARGVQQLLGANLWVHMRPDEIALVIEQGGVPPHVDGPDEDERLIALFARPDPRAADFLKGFIILFEVDAGPLEAETARVGSIVDDGQHVRVGERLGKDMAGSLDFTAQLTDGGDAYVLLVRAIPLQCIRAIHHPKTLPRGSDPARAITHLAEASGAGIHAGSEAMDGVSPRAQRRARTRHDRSLRETGR